MKLEIEKSFYREEERRGYLVSEKMKKIWAVELDLLFQLQQVCEKYGIQYYASGGTILGAERHKGFIPWDDDVDMMMMRDQYDLLCQHADAFQPPYFLQFFEDEEGYFRGHAQLRNSDTTAIVRSELPRRDPYNQGIFIDIFPLDNVVRNRKLLQRQIRDMKHFMKLSRWMYRSTIGYRENDSSLSMRAAHLISPLSSKFYTYRDAYAKFEEACRRYNHVQTKYVGKISFKPEGTKMYDLRSEFDSTVYLDFEMLKIPAPAGYKLLLRRQYGDYSKFVIGDNYHGSMIFDPDLPYTDWLRLHRDEIDEIASQR